MSELPRRKVASLGFPNNNALDADGCMENALRRFLEIEGQTFHEFVLERATENDSVLCKLLDIMHRPKPKEDAKTITAQDFTTKHIDSILEERSRLAQTYAERDNEKKSSLVSGENETVSVDSE